MSFTLNLILVILIMDQSYRDSKYLRVHIILVNLLTDKLYNEIK
jgi:hypothetical protein